MPFFGLPCLPPPPCIPLPLLPPPPCLPLPPLPPPPCLPLPPLPPPPCLSFLPLVPPPFLLPAPPAPTFDNNPIAVNIDPAPVPCPATVSGQDAASSQQVVNIDPIPATPSEPACGQDAASSQQVVNIDPTPVAPSESVTGQDAASSQQVVNIDPTPVAPSESVTDQDAASSQQVVNIDPTPVAPSESVGGQDAASSQQVVNIDPIPVAPSEPASSQDPASSQQVVKPPNENAVEWISTSPKEAHTLCDRALDAGYESNDGGPLWIIRAQVRGDLIPGKLAVKQRRAYVPWGGGEHFVHCIEVCCVSPDKVCWQECRDGEIPSNAIVAGNTSNGESLYVGRAKEQGSLTPGKVQPSHGMLYIPYAGREVSHNVYEVLCLL